MSWFCQHSWIVLDKVIIPSGIEMAKKVGITKMDSTPSGFFTEVHRTIVSCESCGKLKVIE